MGHKVFMEVSTTGVAPSEICRLDWRLSLSNKRRDELCSM